ncbi:protein AAR2 homolog [Gordionus sp. m RMFG-2023]|uniref:protein AAR2 homolog n=1 Tax=Gordionus sp. m RMFG-2023 TaxID=3053472 RepID=UPI0031FE121A
MDPNLINALATNCGCILILDLPIGTTFGIDINCWNTDTKFKGIKLIPPGLHFIFTNSNDSHGNSSFRSGFFHWFESKDIQIKQWCKNSEVLLDNELSHEEALKYKSNILSFDQDLAPYPYDSFKKWTSLTNYITKDILNKLNSKIISSCPDYTTKKFISSKKGTIKELVTTQNNDNEHNSYKSINLPKIQPDNDIKNIDDLLNIKPEYTISYTTIPKRLLYPKNSNPSDITKHNLDTSYTLQSLIIPQENEDNLKLGHELLGEIQFSFICFIYGHHFESFDQWKKLVLLLCNSETAIRSIRYTNLYIGLISVLYYHIQEIPADFFIDIIEDPSQNFLINTLNRLFNSISLPSLSDEDEGRKKLVNRAKNFKNYLRKNGYHFKSSKFVDDEYPVVIKTF